SFSPFPPPPRLALFPYTTLFRSLLGPCDGVVCALFQGLRNVGGILPLLGGGAAGHDEPDHGDPFVCFFYVHIRSIRPQAEGIVRSEEHTSELQSRFDLVCRLLLE